LHWNYLNEAYADHPAVDKGNTAENAGADFLVAPDSEDVEDMIHDSTD
jgi:hypothetical protein